MTTLTRDEIIARELEQVRDIVRRNVPRHGHPERFHEDKSEVEGQLTRLITALRRGTPPQGIAPPSPPPGGIAGCVGPTPPCHPKATAAVRRRGIMKPDRTAKAASSKPVAEILLKADSISLALSADKEGKIRVNCASWEDAKVMQAGQVLEARNQGGQVVLVRREGK